MTESYHIFVSYSRANSDKKDQIVSDLRDFGFQVWVDSSNIRGSEAWLKQIQEGIRNSKILVYLGSEEALKSHYIAYELGYADALGLAIYPTLVKGLSLETGIPDWLLPRQSISLRGEGQYEQNKTQFFKELCKSIANNLRTELLNQQLIGENAKINSILRSIKDVGGRDDYLELYESWKRSYDLLSDQELESLHKFNNAENMDSIGKVLEDWSLARLVPTFQGGKEFLQYRLTPLGEQIASEKRL